MISKTCTICNSEYQVYNYKRNSKFCSLKCYHESLVGQKHTQQRNDQISKALKDRIFSAEHRNKLSLSAQKRVKKYGKDANNWQGGKTKLQQTIRTSSQYLLWRTNLI